MDDAELRAYFERIDAHLVQGDARAERMENAMRTGFQRTDLRFNHMEERFNQADRRFEQMRTEFAELRVYVAQRFDRFTELMAGHFEYVLVQINERLDRLEQRT
ncbi:MAG: hypothetical protein ACT4O1_00530 [Gemmatimonadota bacterium]